MSSGERVAVEVAGGIADVALSRPDRHNALDYAMFEAISAAVDEVAADASVRAVVLRGEGPSFCSGLDFPSFMQEGRPIDAMFGRRDGEDANLAQRVSYGWTTMPAPVIAAVHGACIGGGAQIALGADIRITAPDAKISIREAHWGLIPDMGITRSLPRLVRSDVARELVLTARFLNGAEAVAAGLATRVDADPLGAARALAAEIAARSPDATRRAKSLLERAWTMDAAASLALEEELQRELLGTPNQLEAVRAGMSGEPPSFSARSKGSAGRRALRARVSPSAGRPGGLGNGGCGGGDGPEGRVDSRSTRSLADLGPLPTEIRERRPDP